MPEAGSVCGSLKNAIPEITERTIRSWKRVARQEPWAGMPEDIDHDHLPHTIDALLDACSRERFERDALRRGVHDASRHGEHRRKQGFDEGLIFREYRILRDTLQRVLREVEPDPGRRARALMRLDAGITALSGASLRGLHRDALEEAGQWPDALDRYLEEIELSDA